MLAISDNGGSTSELIRVLGGPSIGDLRARLTRLIDTTQSEEKQAIKDLLSYRLSKSADSHTVREEWMAIVEGHHRLWNKIPTEKKETIRGFLVAFNTEIIKRAYKCFDFRNGSIGNFFLTGARLFFGSLEAAIFLFAAITGIEDRTSVLPVIVTNHTAAIAAELEDGDVLRGQCEISHPSPSRRPSLRNPMDTYTAVGGLQSPPVPDGSRNMNSNLIFEKATEEKLSSAITRLYYMNEFGQEIYPWPNPKVIDSINSSETLIYSIGSLYTSILPCLILRGVGRTISQSPSLKHKILILNGFDDRETEGCTAVDFINIITNGLNQSQAIDAKREFYERRTREGLRRLSVAQYEGYPLSTSKKKETASIDTRVEELLPRSPPSDFITHMIYISSTEIEVDVERIERMGIRCIKITQDTPEYTDKCLQPVLEQIIRED